MGLVLVPRTEPDAGDPVHPHDRDAVRGKGPLVQTRLFLEEAGIGLHQRLLRKRIDMGILLIIVSLAIFLFGLIQWARGGAALWSLLRLKKEARPSICVCRSIITFYI